MQLAFSRYLTIELRLMTQVHSCIQVITILIDYICRPGV